MSNADGVAEAELASQQGKVDQAFQKLDGVQRLFGESLQVTEKGLAQRQRSGALPRDISQAWQKLKAEQESLSPAVRDARHRQLRDSVRQLVSHVGDTSNLILDPDLDS